MDNKQDFERTHCPYVHYVIRPIGCKCLPWVIRLGLRPNQLTLASNVTLLVSMTLFGLGEYWSQLLAAVILQLRAILDTLDGELARKTEQTSQKGEYLDAIGGYLLGGLLLPSISLGLARVPGTTHRVLDSVVHLSSWQYVAIGLWAGLANVLVRLISLRYRHLFGDSLSGSEGKIVRVASSFEDLLPFLLMLAAAITSLHLILLIMALYYTVRFLYVVYRSLMV